MRNEDRRKESLWLWQAGAALLAAAGFVLLADSGPAGRIWAGWLFLAAAVLLLAGASRLRDRVIRPLEQLYQALSGSAPMDQLVQQAPGGAGSAGRRHGGGCGPDRGGRAPDGTAAGHRGPAGAADGGAAS